MNIKSYVLSAFLLVFAVLATGYANADISSGSSFSGFDVSIDRVKVNSNVVTTFGSNLIADSNTFSVAVEFTAVRALNDGHVEAVLRGRQTGDVVSDATGNFDLAQNQNSLVQLSLALTDGLKREDQFDLTIKIIDVRGNSEQKTYQIKTKQRVSAISGRAFDVSIDRVRVNGQVVAPSRTNFIDESNDFDVDVEFTALEDMEDSHVEAILRDLSSGNVVADATSNFDLSQDSSSSQSLNLELLDNLKQSSSFELAIKIINAEGDSVQQTYGIRMRDDNAVGRAGRQLDISIDSVELEDSFIAEDENNFIIIDSTGKKLDLRVRLTSLEDAEDAHVDAVLAFENGDVVSDATTTFDISDGQSVAKRLELPLIEGFEQNNFKLKVKITDAEGNSEEKIYGLKISRQSFPFIISSIALSPEDNAEAGKALIARLTFKNSGVVPLEGISAKVSIPELGISSTKFVDQIKNSGRLSEVREDFILKVLDDTPTGTYTLRSEIASQFGGSSEVKEIPVFILGRDEQSQQIVNDKLVIKVPIANQKVFADSEVIYPITLTNQGPDAETYTLLLDGADWANLRLSESNTFVLEPKESKTLNVYVSSKEDVKGEQIFTIAIKNNGEVLQNIILKGNVISAQSSFSLSLKGVLEAILIGVVVLLAVIGLIFGIRQLMSDDEYESTEAKLEGEAYYS